MEDDRVLIQTASIATAVIVLGGFRLRRRPFLVNFLLMAVVLIALIIYAYRIHLPTMEVLDHLYRRVYTGETYNNCLLLFWLMCIVASVMFVLVVNATDSSSTEHRKFFHLTASLIAVSGLRFDPIFVRLAAVLIICIFVILETLRALHVPPWSTSLNAGLLIFVDKQDSPAMILTPIFLQIGIFLPILWDPVTSPATFGTGSRPFALCHLAGVLSVGAGDAAAAIIGSRFGRRRWRRSPGKSIEGSLAFIVAFTMTAVWLNPDPTTLICLIRIMVAGSVCAIAEAHLRSGDNVVLPIIAYLIL